jgi:spore coat polysaccharide biosynthesis protein SpsF
MRIGAIVHARLSSRRLPGKVLRALAGEPLLGHLFARLGRAEGVDALLLATSTAADDDAIAAFAEARGIACHRGPLDDVAARLLGAAEAHKLDAVVRINGDSPLLDPALVTQAVRLFRRGGVDLTTNVFPRSFPKGQSVEVIATAALARVVRDADPADREHVTQHLYRHAGEFRIHNFAAAVPHPELQLSVDTPDDFRRIEGILERAGPAAATMDLARIIEIAETLCTAPSPP